MRENPEVCHVTSDQKFMMKTGRFQFARSCLEFSKWLVESLRYTPVFCKNCILSNILDQH
jgi:hypothetical protein